MPLKTTCIGAFPKPEYVQFGDWFSIKDGMTSSAATAAYTEAGRALSPAEAEDLFQRAAADVIADQIACGIDIPTDGEVRRENYIHYHCRHLNGFDFVNLTHRVLRNGAYETDLPTIREKISPKGNHFLDHDFRVAQAVSDRPIKVTVPGPVTISDTTADEFYDDPKKLGRDLAEALNFEILALAEAGCTQIQVDEPLFARKPQAALDYGIENLERCFHGVPADVTKIMHMCCGYPNALDQKDYLKADPESYRILAEALDRSAIDQVSIEDAHRHNDLELLDKFQQTTVIFGCIAIASSAVETVDQVAVRLRNALNHIDADRLIAAPDCGLGFLGRDLAMTKLKVMCAAARSV